MPLIEWRDKFRVGVPSVDHEHQELIALINRLHEEISRDATTLDVAGALGEIYSAVSAHFALEERLMRDQRYFEYTAHKAEHERLLDEIREIMDDYEIGTYGNYEERLSQRLNDWFTLHFKSFDARLHAFLD